MIEKMRESKLLKVNIITSLMCLVPMIIGLVFYSRMPDRIPVHFDMYGKADSYAGKFVGVFGAPLLLFAVHLVTIVGRESDAKKKNSSYKMQYIISFLIPVIAIIAQCATIMYVLNEEVNTAKIITIAIGISLILLGNYLPKCKQNFTIGYKTPWTLSNELVWDRTHRFGGILMFLGGIGIIIVCLLNLPVVAAIIGGVALFGPFVYSLIIYFIVKDKKGE